MRLKQKPHDDAQADYGLALKQTKPLDIIRRVMFFDILQLLSAFSTCLLAGLMMNLVFIMHKHWASLDDETYKTSFRNFLRVAKGHPLISALVFVSLLAPLGSGVAHFGSAEGALLLGSSCVFLLGFVAVTLHFNFPIYESVMEKTNAELGDPHDIRLRFFHLNIVRLLSTLVSSILIFCAIGLSAP